MPNKGAQHTCQVEPGRGGHQGGSCRRPLGHSFQQAAAGSLVQRSLPCPCRVQQGCDCRLGQRVHHLASSLGPAAIACTPAGLSAMGQCLWQDPAF